MPRYVDADKLHYKTVLIANNGFYTKPDTVVFAKEIDKSVIEDVRENIHGEWLDASDISGGEYYRCSECGTYVEKTYFANDYMVNFYPNCGADMRKRREDDEIH